MSAYVIAGLLFTIAFGAIVVWAFHGITVGFGTSRAKGIAEIAGGVIVLGFAVLILTGRVSGPHATDSSRTPNRWERLLDEHRTLRTAAFAGPTTHIPGLFYLVALNVIVAHDPTVSAALIEILIYNVIWFALAITALAICIFQPSAARAAVEAVTGWTRQHARAVLLVVALAVGVVLLIHGLLTI
jgi:Sap, sulfolipid-1-addressing protein